MKKQIFFSHDWRIDSQGRNNHIRVHSIVKQIQKYGYSTWFDEEDMNGNIDAAMADGIEHADAVIVCITETYCNKINNASRDSRKRDNCLKEWTYAHARNKLMIPIIMEPQMLDTSKWPPGVVSMYLASTLYINATKDNDNITILSLIKVLEINGIRRNSLPPIKTELTLNFGNNMQYTKPFDCFDAGPYIFDKYDDELEDTAPDSPIKHLSSIRPISPIKHLSSSKPLSPIKSACPPMPLSPSKKKITRSKTTNFTFTRMSPIFFPQSFMENNTRIRTKSEVIKNRRFNFNCSYLPNNPLFSHCMPRRVTI